MMKRSLLLSAVGAIATAGAISAALAASPAYDRHVVFDNARVDGPYFYSEGGAVAPSELDVSNGKLPVETSAFHSAPNALRLHWTSHSGGDWWAGIGATKIWGPRGFDGDALRFWVYAEDEINPGNSPRIMLADSANKQSPTINLIGSLPRIPAHQWTEVVLPFKSFVGLFQGTTDTVIDPQKLERIAIVQGLDDGKPHTVYLDDIRVADAVSADHTPPPVPAGVTATGYDRHIELAWAASPAPDIESWRIYRSTDGKPFAPIAIQRGNYVRYEDFLGASGRSARYEVSAIDTSGNESAPSAPAGAATRAMSDDELLTMVQRQQFNYYWDGAHPHAGMAIELTPGNPDQVALGSSGFGIMALVVGADRGFVTRDQAAQRMLKIVRFLKTADRFHGVWPHFLNGNTGKTMPVFGKYDDGGDLIETAFLMQGLLTARQYFTHDTPAEREIRDTITGFWRTVEWDWYRKSPDSKFLYWHWSPDYGFHISHPLIGWNETLIAYLLGIASPTHGIPASMWNTGWAGTSDLAVAYRRNWSRTTDGDHFVNGHSYYGIKLDVGEGNGAELFFGQFSFLGFDPRGKHDAYTDYFKNNRNIALISHAYAMDNPRKWVGYGDDAWGQSAGVNAGGGRARPADDNGTLTVHASLGAMPYTPVESMKALKHYYRDLGGKIWGVYGFSDGFNASQNWYDEVYMGLNQAQTVDMIENYRTGLLWKLFMSNPEIKPALDRIGFKPD